MTELSKCCGAKTIPLKGYPPTCSKCGNEVISQSQEYSLNCENCGAVFQSTNAFPEPQLCPKCSISQAASQPERLLTDAEINKITKFYTSGWVIPSMVADLLKAQDAKTYPIVFEAGKKEGMRELAEKIKQALEKKNRIAAVENVLELEGK